MQCILHRMRYAQFLRLFLAIAVAHTATLSLTSANETSHATASTQTPPETSTKPASATDEDPELAALPEATRARAKQTAFIVMQSTSLAELRQRLKSMDAQVAQVAPEMKPLFDYVKKKIQIRIAQLKAKAAPAGAITTKNSSQAVTIAPTTIATTPTAPAATAAAPTEIATTPITTLEWADVLEQNPNPKVVTNADLLARMKATGLPWRVKDKSVGIEMLLVPPGKFIMGASPGDTEATDEEKPAHEVTLTKPFYLGRTEITQAQWSKVTGEEAGHFKLSGEHPVESVTFEKVNNFLKRAGNGLVLPTEAQWEYACRAGTKAATYGDLDSIAWYSKNSQNTTHAVAQTLANALGFYDMLGNVSEWCLDWYEPYTAANQIDPSGPVNGTNRVLCGGRWFNYSSGCRASARASCDTNYRSYGIGFRVARTP